MKIAARRGANFRTEVLVSLPCTLSVAVLIACSSVSAEPQLSDEQAGEALRAAMEKKNYPEAERLLLIQLKKVEGTPIVPDPSMPNQKEWQLYHTLSPLADVYCKEQKWAEAEATYKRELAVNEKINGFVEETLKDLANCYRAQRKFSQAEPLSRQALNSYEKAHARETTLAEANQNLAELLTEEGKDAEAETIYKRALKYEMFDGGPFDPHMITDFNVLTRLFKSQANDAAEAAQSKLHQDKDATATDRLAKLYLSHEVEPSIKKIDTQHGGPDAALHFTLLAATYAAEGKLKEAEPLLHDALISTEYMDGPSFNGYALTDQPDPKDPTFGDKNPDVAKRLNNIAELFVLEGKFAEAEPLLKRALMITKTTMGENHPRVATTMKLYAQVLRKMGKAKEAEKLDAKEKSILTPQG
jgi:tetratricopeptide (TPR) repeat protein